MEYGKNYDLDRRVVCETGMQIWISKSRQMSQGHAAYASDALLVTKMNLNPGGSVPKLRDGWFVCNGCRISQPMVFPIDHPTNPDQPKGIKQVLTERGLWRQGMLLEPGQENGVPVPDSRHWGILQNVASIPGPTWD